MASLDVLANYTTLTTYFNQNKLIFYGGAERSRTSKAVMLDAFQVRCSLQSACCSLSINNIYQQYCMGHTWIQIQDFLWHCQIYFSISSVPNFCYTTCPIQNVTKFLAPGVGLEPTTS
jgi:hypothetical protein